MNKRLNVTSRRERECSAAEAGAACSSFQAQPISSFPGRERERSAQPISSFPGGGGKQFRGLVSPFRFFKTKFFYKRFSVHTKIFAFTLAEVLITLAIIGVVAAMTIPSVLNHAKETQLKTGLKKAQSVLSSALGLMIYETGVIPNYKNYTGNSFFPVFKTYLSGLKDYCEGTVCSSYYIPDEIQDVYHTYNNGTNMEIYRFDEGSAILTDGMLLMVQNTNALDGIILLSIDVNGLGNKPNKWGHDLFTFQIDPDTGELIPMGHPNAYYNSSYCSKTSTSTINGIGCTYKALTEKDYFKNLP